MGGVLPTKPASATAPTLTINVAKDVNDLAAVHIVKIWSKGGVSDSSVTPIALSDLATGCLKWTDPSFDAAAQTLYYVRVVEKPTWRWSHYDCIAAPLANPTGCGPTGNLNRQIAERAWTSPIWYQP